MFSLFSYKDPREHNVKVVVALLGILLLEGFILTVRTVLGGSNRVVVCSRLGGEILDCNSH